MDDLFGNLLNMEAESSIIKNDRDIMDILFDDCNNNSNKKKNTNDNFLSFLD